MILAALFLGLAPNPSSSPAQTTLESFRETIVALHDRERLLVGSPPIVWNDDLARDAGAWARTLAAEGSFEHDETDRGQGENLWMGTRGAFGVAEMIAGWSDEKRVLARLSSWEDDFSAVGHYTQMVWKDTRSVGCAVARSRTDDYLVCRYHPQGNVMGESPFVHRRAR